VQPLTGVRVLDRSEGISGPYATKVLADAGADVAKVEPVGGDSLRRWGSGALFDYLNAGKRSVTSDAGLVDAADILVAGAGVDVGALRAAHHDRDLMLGELGQAEHLPHVKPMLTRQTVDPPPTVGSTADTEHGGRPYIGRQAEPSHPLRHQHRIRQRR